MVKKGLIVLMGIVLAVFALAGCTEENPQVAVSPEQKETQLLKETQQSFIQNQPVPKIDWSLERENVIKRIERWNDPNKISYIYLVADNGVIMAFFPIKGKVTALNSFATPNLQIVKDPYVEYSANGGYSGAGQVVDAPDELGTYGENNDGVFFFLTDGTYMEWTGRYLLADQPIKLTQQPIMVYEDNG
jgi:hypothetical protein